jgi:hypothetical protein
MIFNSVSNLSVENFSLNGKRYSGLGNVNEEKINKNDYIENGIEVDSKIDEKQSNAILIE